MKFSIFTCALVLALTSQTFAQDVSTSVRKSPPTAAPTLGKSAVSAELLGRAAIYSFNYDYNFVPNVAAGAGLAFWSQSEGTTTASLVLIPIYGNVYILTGSHRPFFTAGLTIGNARISNENDSASGTGSILTLGAGYELRTEGGFLMRLAGYRLASGTGSAFWPGLSFGGSF
jgi:hypothetical protein